MASRTPSTNRQPIQDGRGEPGSLIVADHGFERGFVQLPVAVLRDDRLHNNAKLLLGFLLEYAWRKGDKANWPGVSVLMRDLGASKRSVYGWIGELQRAQYLTSTRRGNGLTNIYELTIGLGASSSRVAKISSLELQPEHHAPDPELQPEHHQELQPEHHVKDIELDSRDTRVTTPNGVVPRDKLAVAVTAPVKRSRKTPQAAEASDQPPKGEQKQKSVIDGLREAGIDWELGARDLAAIRAATADATRIVDACTVLAARAGQKFWSEKQTVRDAIDYTLNCVKSSQPRHLTAVASDRAITDNYF